MNARQTGWMDGCMVGCNQQSLILSGFASFSEIMLRLCVREAFPDLALVMSGLRTQHWQRMMDLLFGTRVIAHEPVSVVSPPYLVGLSAVRCPSLAWLDELLPCKVYLVALCCSVATEN